MQTVIDRRSPVPLYHQIKQIMLGELRTPDLGTTLGPATDGKPFLTEEQLVQRFHVSRAPVRQALKELVDEGYLYRKRSKGTFPVRGPVRNASRRLGGLVHHLRDQGLEPRSRVSNAGRVRPPEHVRSLIGLAPDADAFALTRTVMLEAGSSPLAWVRTYMDVPRTFEPLASELEEAGTVFVLLERDLGLTLPRGEQQIWASAATEADALALGLRTGAPILVTETTMFGNDGRVFGWSRAVHRADVYKYVFTVTR